MMMESASTQWAGWGSGKLGVCGASRGLASSGHSRCWRPEPWHCYLTAGELRHLINLSVAGSPPNGDNERQLPHSVILGVK